MKNKNEFLSMGIMSFACSFAIIFVTFFTINEIFNSIFGLIAHILMIATSGLLFFIGVMLSWKYDEERKDEKITF